MLLILRVYDELGFCNLSETGKAFVLTVFGRMLIRTKKIYQEVSMGKTTVLVDETLIKHALQVTNLKTKKEVIGAGLRELVRKKNQEFLQQELGSFDLDLSLKDLRKRRTER